MNRHNTPQPPVKIRKRDWLRLPDDQRAIGPDQEILIKSAGGRMVRAQVID